MNTITSAVAFVFVLLLLFDFTNATFIETFLKISTVLKQNSINSVIVYTCNNDFRKSYLRNKQILDNGILYTMVDAHKIKNIFNDRFKYRREAFIIESNCPDQIMQFIAENLDSTNKILQNANIFVNSQIFFYQSTITDNNYSINCNYLYDVYRIGKNYSLNYKLISDKGKSFNLSVINELESTGRRRRNLQKILFQCSIVILFPQYFTYMTDFRKTSYDSFSKWSFPIAKLLVEDLNFSYNCTIVNSFGWDVNGTGDFNGLVGRLQRKENDFGMSGLLMRTDRISACDYTGETIQVRSPLIFRKPSLSSISNIFVLPFNFSVWISSLALCLFVAVLICFQLWIQNRINLLQHNDNRYTDILTFIFGAMCQQGSSLNPNTSSLRITVFLVFMAAIFLFTSYSANIVALLQTPSNSIKTLNNLIDSPIVVGAHNSTYNIVFLTESQSETVKRLFKKKIEPRGDKGFLKSDEGLDLVRGGMFAFQIDAGYAYNYISGTFTEQEKCGLDEIEAIQLPLQTIPVRKHFPYRDLFTQRLRWQRECGLIDRVRRSLVPQKPKCESSHVGFISVGLIEFKPALRVIAYGIICAILIFLFEIIYNRILLKLYYVKKSGV